MAALIVPTIYSFLAKSRVFSDKLGTGEMEISGRGTRDPRVSKELPCVFLKSQRKETTFLRIFDDSLTLKTPAFLNLATFERDDVSETYFRCLGDD